MSRLECTIQQAGGKTFVVNCQTATDSEIADAMAQLREFGSNSAALIGDINETGQGESRLAALQAWQEEATPALVHLTFDMMAQLVAEQAVVGK